MKRSFVSIARAFSLVEICLALGIFAFSVVTILALFPVAIQTSAESQAVSRATEIGTSILAELRAGPFTNSALSTEESPCQLDLSIEADSYLLLNENGARIRTGEPGDYFSGARGPAVYVARIRTRPVTGARPRVTSVTLDVESPANAPASARVRQSFVTILREE